MLMNLPQLAEYVGLSVETLVDYEAFGLIRPIVDGVAPRYGSEARLRLEVIAKGRQLGFTLREIKKLIDAHPVAKPRLLP